MKTLNFSTNQKGYGRQGLYFYFQGAKYYLMDVYPNVPEHFNDFELINDCFFNEETKIYTDLNGREVTPIDGWDEFLIERYKEEIGRVLYENIDHEDFDFDFDNSTYDQITDWALNYK